MSELAGGAVGRATLYAKGATEDQAMAFLQPIVIDTHAINNPWLNYSIYLCNTLFPGVLMLLIFMTTAYTLGTEIKENTGKELMALADNSIVTALVGKILPWCSSSWLRSIISTCTDLCISHVMEVSYP